MKCLLATALLLFAAHLSAQCVTCPALDGPAVQAALDATAAAGGGVVELEPRVYSICSPLIVGSNTHLRGAMRGSTVVRAVHGYLGSAVSNSYVSSLIGTVGTKNVTISDLTADIFTCNVHANVISLLPTSITAPDAYDGTVVTNAAVERVEVLGAPGYHSYMIWNLRGQHIRFLDNWVDGKSTSASEAQEGLESYGGVDVLIQGNTVKNIGNACVTLGSGAIADSDTEGLRVVDNYLSGCTVGINVTASGVYHGESNAHTLIRGNVIVDSRAAGIDASVDVGAYERDLQIAGNTIRNVSSSFGAGIRLRSNGPAIGKESVIGSVVDGNHVEDVTGEHSFGIYVLNYPGARVLNNTVIDTWSDGIRIYNSSDTEVVGNRISGSGNTAVGVYRAGSLTSERVMVERNRISDWSPLTSGVLVLGTSRGTVKDNVFVRSDTAVSTPVVVTSGSCGFTISGNVPWYPAKSIQLTSPTCP